MDAKRIIGRLQAIPPVLWIILLMMLVFSLISGRYMTVNNMINTVQQGAVLLIVAAAATMIILSEGLDLSLGGVLTIAGVTTVMTLNATLLISTDSGMAFFGSTMPHIWCAPVWLGHFTVAVLTLIPLWRGVKRVMLAQEMTAPLRPSSLNTTGMMPVRFDPPELDTVA